ncbi:MAG TPA: PilN domain-containing protein [Magnetospirillaceae bacterium]|nr:PilN domain-containing protein [Magnetospirillaceae bacterium]
MIALWRWWYGQMTALRPGKRHDLGRPSAIWRQNELILAETGSPAETAFTLHLADRQPWRRHLTLPNAARPFLRQILRNEMDRRTPWPDDQVYFTLATGKSPDPGQMAVTLSVLPRRWAAPALDALLVRGLRVDRIRLEENGPALSIADGEPVADVGPSGRAGFILAAVMGVALLSLALQTGTGALLDIRLSDARREAAVARTLVGETDALRRRQHFPSVRRDELPSAIALLNRVSRILPDGSWIDELELKDRKLVLGGISGEPAKLLPLLQAGGFAGVEFAAPVVPAEGGGQRFQIRADIVGSDRDFR